MARGKHTLVIELVFGADKRVADALEEAVDKMLDEGELQDQILDRMDYSAEVFSGDPADELRFLQSSCRLSGFSEPGRFIVSTSYVTREGRHADAWWGGVQTLDAEGVRQYAEDEDGLSLDEQIARARRLGYDTVYLRLSGREDEPIRVARKGA
jgi:hypothetical protein